MSQVTNKVGSAIILLIIGVLAYIVLMVEICESKLGPFKDHLGEYTDIPSLEDPSRKDLLKDRIKAENTLNPPPTPKQAPSLSAQIGLSPTLLLNPSPGSMQPYVKGKVILVNKEEKKIDHTYCELPEELRATRPEEVETIVWLEWGKDKVGRYTDGSTAYVNTCKVTIIDRSIPAIVAVTNLRGSMPPNMTTRGGGAGGSMPTEEVIAYLQNLPRK